MEPSEPDPAEANGAISRSYIITYEDSTFTGALSTKIGSAMSAALRIGAATESPDPRQACACPGHPAFS